MLIFETGCNFQGHEITQWGVEPDLEKIATLLAMPTFRSGRSKVIFGPRWLLQEIRGERCRGGQTSH
jgi:hypothetical protein